MPLYVLSQFFPEVSENQRKGGNGVCHRHGIDTEEGPGGNSTEREEGLKGCHRHLKKNL